MAAKKPTKKPKRPKGRGTPDGGTWVEAQPPTWLERRNAPSKRKKTGVKKRASATKSLARFRKK